MPRREKLCEKREEGFLLLVKEFYTNLDERVDDKVFVREKCQVGQSTTCLRRRIIKKMTTQYSWKWDSTQLIK